MTNIQSIPSAAPADIVEWSRTCGIKVDGHSYNPDRIPQNVEPLKFCANPTQREGTLIKPVQCGGSTVGEVAIGFWLAFYTGLLQYNWQDDLRADERWENRILKMLKTVKDLKWAGGRYDEKICHASFINSNLAVQGVLSSGALDSETVPLQVNEEIHLWEPGTLAKAARRHTLVWNYKMLNISNAGAVKDQLESAWEEGSMEVWESFCPFCSNPHHAANAVYHPMKFRWNDKRPDLGGLRFDTSVGRKSNGKYSMSKVAETIRYQMPCGGIVRDLPAERRPLDVGRYLVTNPDALSYKRSWNYEAVSVSEIRLPELVEEWLTACKAAKAGDLVPMKRFVQERECRFYDPDTHLPFSGQIVISTTIKKNREGLPDRAMRQANFDWQQGYKHKGQLIHYWGVIRDVKPDCNSQLVWEGMVNSEAELLALVQDLQVDPIHVTIDASKNTKAILQFCYQNDFKAVMGNASHVGTFRDHDDKIPRFYSAGKPIHSELNVPPKYEYVFGQRKDNGEVPMVPDPREPIVIMFNLGGLLANHFFCRELKARVTANCAEENPPRIPEPTEYFEMVIPSDVSEDFMRQYQSWERLQKDAKQKAGDIKSPGAESFRQLTGDDHMFMCVAYGDMMLDWNFMLGDALANLGPIKEQDLTEKEPVND